MTSERGLLKKLLLKHILKTKFICVEFICKTKKGSDGLYVIWVKMIDLQKSLVHQNLCYAAMKKIRSYCKTKYPSEEQDKQYKRKMDKWIDDNKSVHVCQDLVYNPGVKEANEFRKNLGVENENSIRIEREMIAIIIKIFAKEIMVRQYIIPGLPYHVNLCFVT